MLPTALTYSHQLAKEIILSGDCVVDATMGNGHDTAFLAQLVGPTGHVFAFDVQKPALIATEQRLLAADLLDRTTLIHDGHEQFTQYFPKQTALKLAIFNLGYLPSSNKQIITHSEHTLAAIQQMLPVLAKRGRILLVSYYGHPGGQEELDHVQAFCQTLPQEEYQVMTYQFINQRNAPPILFCIEKK
ncbi:class I SAM-dependent methyltransferase [Enterococcus italicus]|uniref:class I SAM-dependent methyltransferase n=1 Tax=Enterococcus italicus TaxID=246144 RepID=UPI0020734F51|nr:class I SAM-dependent methyltransferase [Enterococcus italicus]